MTGPRSARPYGKTAEFANAVFAKHGKAFCDSWLGPKATMYDDDTVYTIGVAKGHLEQKCEAVIWPNGRKSKADVEPQPSIRIRVCPDVTRAFYHYVDTDLAPRLEAEKKPAKKKGKP